MIIYHVITIIMIILKKVQLGREGDPLGIVLEIEINKRKRTCHQVDFVIPVDYRRKIKENQKKDKYFDFARELRKLWNIKLMMIPIVIGVTGRVSKDLEMELEKLEIRG